MFNTPASFLFPVFLTSLCLCLVRVIATTQPQLIFTANKNLALVVVTHQSLSPKLLGFLRHVMCTIHHKWVDGDQIQKTCFDLGKENSTVSLSCIIKKGTIL